MKKIFGTHRWVGVVVLAVMLLGVPLATLAGVDYCWGDPIFKVGPDKVNVNVGIPADKVSKLLGPVKVVLEVPLGAPASILFVATHPFVEEAVIVPTTTLWKPNGINPITVRVLAPATQSFPVAVQITAEGKTVVVSGSSNQTISYSRTLNAAQ